MMKQLSIYFLLLLLAAAPSCSAEESSSTLNQAKTTPVKRVELGGASHRSYSNPLPSSLMEEEKLPANDAMPKASSPCSKPFFSRPVPNYSNGKQQIEIGGEEESEDDDDDDIDDEDEDEDDDFSDYSEDDDDECDDDE